MPVEMPGDLLECGKGYSVCRPEFGERCHGLSYVGDKIGVEEFRRGFDVLEGSGTSQYLAPVVASKSNGRKVSGPPAEVDFMCAADIQAAVGQPNGGFGVSGEVVEKIYPEGNHMMTLATCLGHIVC